VQRVLQKPTKRNTCKLLHSRMALSSCNWVSSYRNRVRSGLFSSLNSRARIHSQASKNQVHARTHTHTHTHTQTHNTWKGSLSLGVGQRQKVGLRQPVVVQGLHGNCGSCLIVKLNKSNSFTGDHTDLLEASVSGVKQHNKHNTETEQDQPVANPTHGSKRFLRMTSDISAGKFWAKRILLG
jgi:hypothetical protein